MTRFVFCTENAARLENDVTAVSIDQALLDLNMLNMEHAQRMINHENACRVLGIYDTLTELGKGSPRDVRQARLTLESSMRYIPHTGLYTEDGSLHTESVSSVARSIWDAICSAFQKLWDWISKTFRKALGLSAEKNKADTKGIEHALKKEKEKSDSKMTTERKLDVAKVADALPHVSVIDKDVIIGVLNETKQLAGFITDYAALLHEMSESARASVKAIEDFSKYPAIRDSFYEAASRTMNALIQQHASPISEAVLKLPAVRHYVQQNEVVVVSNQSTEMRMPTHSSVAVWLQTTAIQKAAHPLFVPDMGGTHRRNTVMSAKIKDAERILEEVTNLHEIYKQLDDRVNDQLLSYCIQTQRSIEETITKRLKTQDPSPDALMAIQHIQNYISAHQLVISQIVAAIDRVTGVVNAYLNATLS